MAHEEIKAKMILCRSRLENVFKTYTNKKTVKRKNLTETQEEGLNSLSKRIEKGEIVFFPTDKKSGVMSVDTPTNYIQSMLPHLEGTIPATMEEYEESEKLLNAHMKSCAES